MTEDSELQAPAPVVLSGSLDGLVGYWRGRQLIGLLETVIGTGRTGAWRTKPTLITIPLR